MGGGRGGKEEIRGVERSGGKRCVFVCGKSYTLSHQF